MSPPASPTVRRRRLAAELREIREDKGKSGDAVAAALRWSPSKISRYERARTGLRPREVERLLDYYQITGPRRALLLGLAQDATQKGWWEEFADSLSEDYQQFIGLEHEAASMAIWHVDVVTGLLQTHHQQLQSGRADATRNDRADGEGPHAAPAGAQPRGAAAVHRARRIGPEAPGR
jgi:transcriptional regulator with XRE-family HTH domain